MIPSMRPEPKRADDGSYILPDPVTGRARSWQRATTLAHIPADSYHLDRWKLRNVALGLKARPELLDRVPDKPPTGKAGKDGLNDLVEEAWEAAGANDGSAAGTDLHSLTEWADAGRLGELDVSEVPASMLDDLVAYQDALADAGIEVLPELIERVVVNTAVGTGGTFDRVYRLPDSRLVIGDLKTQKTVRFGWLEIAIQLAEYAYADAMLGDDGELEDMPDVDRTIGLVVHLPAGRAEASLWEVDLVEGWEAALLAARTREFRRASRGMGWPYRPVSRRLAAARRDQLGYLIDQAPTPEALRGLWDGAEAWQQHHTEAAKAKKAREGWE